MQACSLCLEAPSLPCWCCLPIAFFWLLPLFSWRLLHKRFAVSQESVVPLGVGWWSNIFNLTQWCRKETAGEKKLAMASEVPSGNKVLNYTTCVHLCLSCAGWAQHWGWAGGTCEEQCRACHASQVWLCGGTQLQLCLHVFKGMGCAERDLGCPGGCSWGVSLQEGRWMGYGRL